jgi:hypothetical protein
MRHMSEQELQILYAARLPPVPVTQPPSGMHRESTVACAEACSEACPGSAPERGIRRDPGHPSGCESTPSADPTARDCANHGVRSAVPVCRTERRRCGSHRLSNATGHSLQAGISIMASRASAD